MKFEGQHRVAAPREVVYKKLLDPEALAKALPGCEKLDPQGPDRYHAKMKVGVGAVKGVYDARVEILDQKPPEGFRMKIEGKGPGSFLKGEGTLSLAENSGGTLVSYSGDAQIGGLLGSVGQRMVQAATRQIINKFFDDFVKQVQAA